MLRVPTCAGVGRLGLPLLASAIAVALWSTSTATASLPPATAAASPLPQPASVRAGGEQVGVFIPSVVFGQADGLGPQLSVGHHPAVVQVWLAAGSPAAVATVRSADAHVRGCTAVALRPGSVNILHCVVDVGRTARSITLTVATSVAGHHFQTSYTHRVS